MLKLYNVDKGYVEYLRKFDNKVSEGKHKRPYIGVVCVAIDADLATILLTVSSNSRPREI